MSKFKFSSRPQTVPGVIRRILLLGGIPAGMLWGTLLSPAMAADSDQLEEVTVTSSRLQLMGTAQTASQGVIVNDELILAPAYRPGQVLETVPGLSVAIHSGEGKANQYLMRGYNLDHGTDLAIFVDDMPVNEPTHAHGDGYADINFMIPELATNVSYTKGPYYAEVGNFGSVGSIRINYLDTIANQASVTVGPMDMQRYFGAGSVPLAGGNLLAAAEYQHYDGPWITDGDQKKINGVLRFSSGTASDGYSVMAMFYHDSWNSATDQPERALTQGLLSSPYDSLDPSDGGYAQRASLSAAFHESIGPGVLSSNVYAISSRLYLWNNFSHYLVDPIDGDQEAQHEDRVTWGGGSNYMWTSPVMGVTTDWKVGLLARFDYNAVSRIPTQNRIALTQTQLDAVDYDPNAIEADKVHLGNFSGYFELTSHWTENFRSVLGFREDYIYGNDSGTHPGSASQGFAAPKLSLIYRLNKSTELYASGGRGFHSDDLRGVNQARIDNISGAPLIASQVGEELGMRNTFLNNKLTTTVAVYHLRAQSETTYDPDAGVDGSGPGSDRRGFEVNVTWQPLHWLEIYGSYSGNRARYTDSYDDGTGHMGRYLPNAPFSNGSLNIYIRDLGPWSGGISYRYLGAFPLTSGKCSDVAVQADFPGLTSCAQAPTAKGQVFGSGYGEWSAQLRYAFSNGWSLTLAGYNLLDKKANSAEYYYVDRLPGEPDYGVADRHFHPLEPITGRFTVSKNF